LCKNPLKVIFGGKMLVMQMRLMQMRLMQCICVTGSNIASSGRGENAENALCKLQGLQCRL